LGVVVACLRLAEIETELRKERACAAMKKVEGIVRSRDR
jgi:hypothetical protein